MFGKIKWGVIGSGGIAKSRTIPEGIIAADNATLITVFDVNAKVNLEVAQKFNVKAAATIDELLADDIDAVYIATPAYLHHELTIQCAKAGKSILCEKPLSTTVEHAKQAIDACNRHGVTLGIALMMRFQSQNQEAMKMIQKGTLGKITYARAQLSCWYPPIKGAWRQKTKLGGGGALMDLGSHCIDLLEMFIGPVKKVSCFINHSIHDYETEDSAVSMLFFENGAIATVDTFFCIRDTCSKNILEIYGSQGSIFAAGTIGQGKSGEMTALIEKEDRCEAERITIAPHIINTYQAEIEEFSQAMLERREPSNSSLVGLRNQKILSACYESARDGKVVEV